MFSPIYPINLCISQIKGIYMTNKTDHQSDQEDNPQKESNDDKGNQDSYKGVKPEKKPNAEPENPLREQK